MSGRGRNSDLTAQEGVENHVIVACLIRMAAIGGYATVLSDAAPPARLSTPPVRRLPPRSKRRGCSMRVQGMRLYLMTAHKWLETASAPLCSIAEHGLM
jgi:hypothetical protein